MFLPNVESKEEFLDIVIDLDCRHRCLNSDIITPHKLIEAKIECHGFHIIKDTIYPIWKIIESMIYTI